MSVFSSIIKKVVPGALSLAADIIPGGSLVKTGLKLAAPALKTVFSGTGAKLVAGTAVAAGGVALAKTTFGGAKVGALPALPALQSGGMAASSSFSPGGSGIMPVPNPGAPNQYAPKPMVLDATYARAYYRAPKGYVILRDPNGQLYCVEKHYARKNGWWKPARKPLLSATDSYHLKRNQQLIKKARKAIGPIIKQATKSSGKCTPSRKKR